MVVKHFVKVIFPFQYNQKEEFDLDEIHCSLNGEKTYKVFQKIGFESVELRRGLSDLFTKEEHKSRIMTAYRVDKIVRGYFDLPQKPTGTIEFYSRAKERTIPYCVELSDMSLYLFESGVGFVEVELRSKSNDLTEQISCNYFLSEIGNEEKRSDANTPWGCQMPDAANFPSSPSAAGPRIPENSIRFPR